MQTHLYLSSIFFNNLLIILKILILKKKLNLNQKAMLNIFGVQSQELVKGSLTLMMSSRNSISHKIKLKTTSLKNLNKPGLDLMV